MTTIYDPRAPRGAGFADLRAGFLAGRETPRDELERRLGVIAAREDAVKAFAGRDDAGARAAGLFLITPSATGAAPRGTGDTGSSVYQWGSSLAGNPVVSLPFMAADAMPLGLEIQGFEAEEAALLAAARALDAAYAAGKI